MPVAGARICLAVIPVILPVKNFKKLKIPWPELSTRHVPGVRQRKLASNLTWAWPYSD